MAATRRDWRRRAANGKTSLLLKVLADARADGLQTVYVDFYRAVTVCASLISD